MSDKPPITELHADSRFGACLRRLRAPAGITQEELAARAGLTAKAVSLLEHGARKRPYPHTATALADALGLSGDDRSSFLASASQHGVPTQQLPILPRPITPLLGRKREVEDIRRLLSESRLVSLVGTAGVGKTRLAIEVACEAPSLFRDGVVFRPEFGRSDRAN